MPGLLDGPTFQLLTQDTELGKGTVENDITRKAWVNELESRRRKPFGRFNRSCDDHDDEMEIDITSEEQCIWDFLFDMKYSIMYGVEIIKTLMHTLREEVKVYSDVVDAWVDVMNYEKVDRTVGCETRIYFRTTVILAYLKAFFGLLEFVSCTTLLTHLIWKKKDSWLLTDSTCDDEERMKTFHERMMGADVFELIGIKKLFFPILENDQYYLIKHMLVAYLERSDHPSKDQFAAAKIKRRDIHWATPAHPMDSAVFLMQHM
ncbi:hypothetical protein Hanom_Chr04g00324151 [Helianthus anomalus]